MATADFEARKAAVQAGASTFKGQARSHDVKREIRAATSSKDGKDFITVDGYASVTNVPYEMCDFFGEYMEVIAPSAFDKTLAANPDVNFLVNHTGVAMARTTAGTLELSVDEVGLRAVAYLNPTRPDVLVLKGAIDDGSVDEMSFAFCIEAGIWSPDYTQFTITEVDLDRGDVSAVNYGANPNTSISARAKQVFEGIEHLSGVPLKIAAERAAAKLAAETPKPVTGRNAATLRALLDLENDGIYPA